VPSACHPDRGFSALLGDLALQDGHVASSWLELVVGQRQPPSKTSFVELPGIEPAPEIALTS
jgi:hypothetical protein